MAYVKVDELERSKRGRVEAKMKTLVLVSLTETRCLCFLLAISLGPDQEMEHGSGGSSQVSRMSSNYFGFFSRPRPSANAWRSQ